MNVSGFINSLAAEDGYQGHIAHVERIHPRKPEYADPATPLDPFLQERLRQLGVSRLYTHQAKALDLARSGKHLMVATPSASGKTLCYNLPVCESLLADRRSRALYLFPTKALAQDQLRTLATLLGSDLMAENEAALFDGDTPPEARREVKQRARIVITNPDMLHLGILPNHGSWARLLRNLKYVVVDEAHTYRGIFGSHVANVLRRLRRLCRLYGSNPQFIACSASIANPKEHAEKLAGLPFEVVEKDGSPRGSKYFVFWNPPLIGEARNARRSASGEATSLLVRLVQEGIRTLVFTRTRKVTELVYLYARQRLSPGPLADLIRPYRGGYTAEDRREIERLLFSEHLLGVVATNALELGIDIGALDATVLTGYPGSIASTWQQAGRSGRRHSDSLSILVALDGPLDQYLMRHPDAFFDQPFENALINPDNEHVLKPHLLCAAWETPLSAPDAEVFGPGMADLASKLAEQAQLVDRGSTSRGSRGVGAGGKVFYPAVGLHYPAQDVSIRSLTQKQFALLDASRGNTLLETVESSMAMMQLHPGAIYLHQGDSFLISELDLQRRIAVGNRTAADYYTQTREMTDLRVLKTQRSKDAGKVKVFFGEVEVTTQVTGFRRKKQFTEEVMGEDLLDLPPQRFATQSLWFSLPAGTERQISDMGLGLPGGLHAAEHAAIGMLPLFALCDRNDIGGVSTPLHPDTGQPGIFIYDACPGGVGIAELGFERVVDLWKATLRVVSECPCHEGCPSCVYSPKCGNNNDPMDKAAARMILRALVG